MTTKGRRRLAMRALPLRDLRPVQLPSLADELDRIDHRTSINGTHEPLPPDDLEDNHDMESPTYTSSERVKPSTIATGGRGGKAHKMRTRLVVPADVASKLPPGIEFEVELTEAGLLFRPAGTRQVRLPAWVSNGHAVKR